MPEYRLQELLDYIDETVREHPDTQILHIRPLLVSLINYERARIWAFFYEDISDPVDGDRPDAHIRQARGLIIQSLFGFLEQDVTDISHSHYNLGLQHQEIQQMDGVITGLIKQHLCDDSRISSLFGTSCSFFRYINSPMDDAVGEFLQAVQDQFTYSSFFLRQRPQANLPAMTLSDTNSANPQEASQYVSQFRCQ